MPAVQTVDPELLALVRCPKCRGELAASGGGGTMTLTCAACRVAYPVIDGIPQLLVEEAKSL